MENNVMTKEELEEYAALVGKLTIENTRIDGAIGSNGYTTHDILHNLAIESISHRFEAYKNKLKKYDDLELNEKYGITKKTSSKNEARDREIVHFLGLTYKWKLSTSIKNNLLREKRQLEDDIKRLKEENKTPEDRIKEMEARSAELDKLI